VDAVNVQPLVVDSIQIFAGQRYSFILNTNQAVSNYWVRALPNVGTQGFEGGVNSAILRYWGAAVIDPTTNETTSTNPMVETNLHPLTNPGAPGVPTPGAADVNINLDIEFVFSTLHFTVNGATFAPPTLPVLLQILSGVQTAQDLLPTGSVYVLPPNKVIELSIPGGSVGSPVSDLGIHFLTVTNAHIALASNPSSRGKCQNFFDLLIERSHFAIPSITLMSSGALETPPTTS
jgi:iron transport multicopper oxidase